LHIAHECCKINRRFYVKTFNQVAQGIKWKEDRRPLTEPGINVRKIRQALKKEGGHMIILIKLLNSPFLLA